ncbi:MAG: hypothetical protein QME42_06345 [bacterium]|nr:hypothetical protein [bacterium]
MLQRFTFIKIILTGLMSLLLDFNISSPVFAEQPISLIKLDKERGWLGSMDFIYSSNIGETEKMRSIKPTFSMEYIFSNNWSFTSNIPFEYMYTSYSHIQVVQEEKREHIFAIGNICFIPNYRFKWKGNWIEFPLVSQFPTLNKISGNLQYKDIEKEKRIFTIEPGIAITKIYDPIVSSIKLSFAQPLWRKEDKKKVYTLWTAKVGGDIFFLINEQFSFFSDLELHIGKKRENYILQHGVAYQPRPYSEWRIYLLNNYESGRWDASLGLSFTIMQRERKGN